MPKRRTSLDIPFLRTVEGGDLRRQLAQALRKAIAAGELRPGEQLPSTRSLAKSLGVARGTVVEAFEQLLSEGYLETRVGSGTNVAAALNETPFVQLESGGFEPCEDCIELPASVERLRAVAREFTAPPAIPFTVAIPSSGVGPDDQWRRISSRVRKLQAAAPAGYSDPLGVPALREAVAEHVRRARAVQCTADQVVITTGTQQGLYLAARVLASEGEWVCTEDPVYPGLAAILDDLGVRAHRVPVDAQGMGIEHTTEFQPQARVAFVTPSHQYPLGMPMSMARRRALIAWAKRTKAWIVEDDYDSELRYAGHPFPSLQGLYPPRVIYLGTFSKVMFPSLRLGYIVAPEPLVEAFAGAHAIVDRHSPTGDQHALAAYMAEGMFDAHIRRIRNLYAERRSVLISALTRAELPRGCAIQPSDQGMHIVLWLPEGLDDVEVARNAANFGLFVRPISPMYAKAPRRHGLMLGFGGFSPDRLVAAVAKLAGLL